MCLFTVFRSLTSEKTMPDTPRFSYHIQPFETYICPHSDCWKKRLPLSRQMSGSNHAEISMTYGEYFSVARAFFERDDCEMLCSALTARLGQTITPRDLREIRIILEKHGEFYHPARIQTAVDGHTFCFVLNIAVSESGNRYLKDEYHILKRLSDEFVVSFLPRVYIFDEIDFGAKRKIRMFLGDWFEGYHEFHLSRDTSDNQFKICVWDDANGRLFLTREQTNALYTQAAQIMTCYYNLQTFEHIAAWHHAAGDFVVKLDQGGLDLKLITVRKYAPLFQDVNDQENAAENAELVLQALLIFFLNLSIQMRLDRIDGIGGFVWSETWVAQTTVAGLFEGLAPKRTVPFLPDSISACFKSYLSVCTQADLLDLSEFLVSTHYLSKPEIALIKQNLPEHVQTLYRAINEI